MENDFTPSVNQAQTTYNSNNYGSNYGQPLKPDNHMALAIITTICCCLPFGIVGIVKASQVNSLYFLKQYAAAQKSADEAKKWSIIGIISGVVIYVIYLAVYGLTFFTAFAGNN